jgi:hypothetical protein
MQSQRRINFPCDGINYWRLLKESIWAKLHQTLSKYWEPLMVAQWLRYCATSRNVVGSIPDGVIGIFH